LSITINSIHQQLSYVYQLFSIKVIPVQFQCCSMLQVFDTFCVIQSARVRGGEYYVQHVLHSLILLALTKYTNS